MSNSKPSSILLVNKENYNSDADVRFLYREAVESLLFLSNKTSPVMAHVVNHKNRPK